MKHMKASEAVRLTQEWMDSAPDEFLTTIIYPEIQKATKDGRYSCCIDMYDKNTRYVPHLDRLFQVLVNGGYRVERCEVPPIYTSNVRGGGCDFIIIRWGDELLNCNK